MIRKPVEPLVTDYLFHKAARIRLPLSGTFELTPLCNMNCKMCYVRMDAAQQAAIRPIATAEQWLALGKRAKESGMLYLLLTGGEPFSHPQIRQIVTGLQEMGLLISINTNGTLIDEQTISWLTKAAPTRINVTLYGGSDGTYQRLCGQKDGYSRAMKAIQLLKAAGIMLKINYSITPDNVQDLPQVTAFCHWQDLVLQTNAYMFPPVRKDAHGIGSNFRLCPEDAAYYTAVAELLTDGPDSFLNRPVPTLTDGEECAEIGDGIRCRAGRCSFWVTWEGKILPCGMFPLQNAPNVFEQDFAQSWDWITRQVSMIRLPAKCSTCGYQKTCRACAAMVYTESGNFNDVPRYRCEMAHQFLPQRQRVKERFLLGKSFILPSEVEK